MLLARADYLQRRIIPVRLSSDYTRPSSNTILTRSETRQHTLECYSFQKTHQVLLWIAQDPTECVYSLTPALIHVPLCCDEGGLSPRRPAVEYLSAQEIKFSSEFSAYYKVMGCPEGEILIWRGGGGGGGHCRRV